jgi:hypothetical protein
MSPSPGGSVRRTRSTIPPYATVEVTFSNSGYLQVCERFGGGPELVPHWRLLGDLLAHRAGWHFDVVNQGEAVWSWGAFGAAVLSISVAEDGRFRCYDALRQSSRTVPDRQQVESWLAGRDDPSRSLSPQARTLLAANGWAFLRRHVFVLRVTWVDGWFVSDVKGVPHETVFATSVSESVRAARVLVTRFCGAPETLAGDLVVRVEMDERATRRVAEPDGAAAGSPDAATGCRGPRTP